MLRPPDKHGNPRGIQYPNYCALPRQQQGYTTCPGHRRRNRRAHGDLVKLTRLRHGTLTGHGLLISNKTRVALIHGGRSISVRADRANLIARNHGYRILTVANSA